MKRLTGHTESWGDFLDIKHWKPISKPEKYVGKELFIGSVTDPYQPPAGVRTTCFILPIFPGITDVKAIIEQAKNYCNLICLENLNLRGSYKPVIMEYIKKIPVALSLV